MCHLPAGRAPEPPNPGAVREHGPVELVSADGFPVLAYAATPATPGRGRVVLLPDVRGLHPFYMDLACRFAQAGFSTLAVDWYGRTAADRRRGDGFAWRDHVSRVRDDQVDTDVQAALGWLCSGDCGPGDRGPAFTVGFCFGGGHSWRLAGSGLELAGAIGFYGLPHLVTGPRAADPAPTLLLLAGRDDETPGPAFQELTSRADATGAPYEMHTYPDAPHSFFDRTSDQWADVCRDAWLRLLGFTDRYRNMAGR